MANKVLEVVYDPNTKELVDLCGSQISRDYTSAIDTVPTPVSWGGGNRLK